MRGEKPAFPVLRIAPEAWNKLWLYIALCPKEVGGLGRLEAAADGALVLGECFLLEQEVTDVDTVLDPEAVSRFLLDYVAAGRDPAELQVWWHSHAREAVFWSTDDERTIEHWQGDSLVALVGNHAGRFMARRDWYRPARATLGWLDVERPAERPPLNDPLAEAVRAELAARVHQRQRHTNKLWTDVDVPHRGH